MRSRFFVFSAFSLLSLSLLLSPAGAAEIQDHLMSGSKFAQEKKYQEAAREFDTAVKIDPKNAEANLLLGLTLANTGDLDGAIKYTLAAVQLKPTYSAYNNLGLIYANQGKYDKAVEAFKGAVDLSPKSYEAWYRLGQVYGQSFNFIKAQEAYEKAIELNPKFAAAYQGLGSAYFWSGHPEAAHGQVAKLRELKADAKAAELENWIKDKEAKKTKAAKKTAKPA